MNPVLKAEGVARFLAFTNQFILREYDPLNRSGECFLPNERDGPEWGVVLSRPWRNYIGIPGADRDSGCIGRRSRFRPQSFAKIHEMRVERKHGFPLRDFSP